MTCRLLLTAGTNGGVEKLVTERVIHDARYFHAAGKSFDRGELGQHAWNKGTCQCPDLGNVVLIQIGMGLFKPGESGCHVLTGLAVVRCLTVGLLLCKRKLI